MTPETLLWVPYTNTDCTEGRCHNIPHAICETQSTAVRLAKKCYVQGSDGPVGSVSAKLIDGVYYVPLSLVNVIRPTKDDIAKQAQLDGRNAAIARAKELGLSEGDLKTLSSGV